MLSLGKAEAEIQAYRQAVDKGTGQVIKTRRGNLMKASVLDWPYDVYFHELLVEADGGPE